MIHRRVRRKKDAWGIAGRTVVVMVCTVFDATGLSAQTGANKSSEQLVEDAREVYGATNGRGCPQGSGDEIVVCARSDADEFRVPSSLDEAIARGDPVDDGIPRAPDLRPPPCVPSLISLCVKMGRPARGPLLIDLKALPEALSPEDAELVFGVEEERP